MSQAPRLQHVQSSPEEGGQMAPEQGLEWSSIYWYLIFS